jgi:ABC-2 type transport system permease protein
MPWFVMYEKEMLEMWRSYKWLWVPLVFLLFGIMQPVVSYYMPQILESAGGLPEGAVIEIPLPTAVQVLAETLSQYNTIGLLILVLAIMGIVSGERVSGAAGMILVKPVSFWGYITAKWAGAATLTVVSLAIGMLGAWYYTEQLIGSLSFGSVVLGWLLFTLWFIFIMAVTVCYSAMLKGNGAVAFLTLLTAIALSVLPLILKDWMKWSPGTLAGHANAAMATGQWPHGVGLPLGATFGFTVIVLFVAVKVFRNKELVG